MKHPKTEIKDLSTQEILQNPCFELIQDVADITKNFFATTDFHFFGYGHIKSNGDFSILGSHHDWPTDIFAHKKTVPWGFTVYDQIKTQTLFPTMETGELLGWPDSLTLEAKNRFSIKNPMVITKKHSDSYELFIFDLHTQNAYQQYISKFEMYENFIHYFKDHAKKIIERAKRNPLRASCEYLKIAEINHKKFAQQALLNSTLFPKPRRYYLYFNNQEISVSAKEFSCLTLLAHGKSYKYIAVTLNVALRTVETYLERLRKKFNLSTRDELSHIYWENRLL